jgi:hypothetical protein
MFCPKCGNQSADDQVFCRQCGAQIGVVSSLPTEPPQQGASQPQFQQSGAAPSARPMPPMQGTQPVYPPRKKMSLWAKIAIGVGVALSLFLLLVIFSPDEIGDSNSAKASSGQTEAQDNLAAVDDGNVETPKAESASQTTSAGDAKRNGYARVEYSDGDVYEGNWQNGQRHGGGTYYYNNGDVYEGNWVNNVKSGYGILHFASGASYMGNFSNGKFNDKEGMMEFASGYVYEGEFYDGERTGYGTQTYSDGYYEGTFYQGLRDGNGVFVWTSGKWEGDWYSGEWLDNKMHGHGEYYNSAKDQIFPGYYEYGKRVSNG